MQKFGLVVIMHNIGSQLAECLKSACNAGDYRFWQYDSLRSNHRWNDYWKKSVA